MTSSKALLERLKNLDGDVTWHVVPWLTEVKGETVEVYFMRGRDCLGQEFATPQRAIAAAINFVKSGSRIG